MAKAKKTESTEAEASAPKKAASKSAAPKSAAKPAAVTKTAAAKSAGAAKPAASKPAASKSAKASKPASMPGAPLIDTGLAAQAAAAMVANRWATGLGGGASSQAANRPAESSSFKNFKDSLNKPSAGGLGGLLGQTVGNKKFAPTTAGPKQTGGRNQTFGADVNRTGVPRRTGG